MGPFQGGDTPLMSIKRLGELIRRYSARRRRRGPCFSIVAHGRGLNGHVGGSGRVINVDE